VDGTSEIVREVKVASEPDALLRVLRNPAYRFKRIGLEAGPLSQWLYGALAESGLPVICVETRHRRAVLKAQISSSPRSCRMVSAIDLPDEARRIAANIAQKNPAAFRSLPFELASTG
jgi:transposase